MFEVAEEHPDSADDEGNREGAKFGKVDLKKKSRAIKGFLSISNQAIQERLKNWRRESEEIN